MYLYTQHYDKDQSLYLQKNKLKRKKINKQIENCYYKAQMCQDCVMVPFMCNYAC